MPLLGAIYTLEVMIEFWNTVTRPLLEALEPRVIVEVGMFQGATTAKLLEFAEGRDTVVHGIDPADPPDFDLEGFREAYGDRFVFHNDTSLAALPRIRDADSVILDGDHNWYTVYNELTTLAQVAAEEHRPFPLTLMHDIDWPWGRRDMYYAPDRVPEEHRQTVTQGGMNPGNNELTERGYMWRVQKAAEADTPRNGVRTAIEDFLSETDAKVTFTSVPGFNGVGVIVDAVHLDSAPVRDAVAALDSPAFLRRQCELVEQERLRAEMRRAHAKQGLGV